MTLILVRHAMPLLEEAVPAHRWRLGPDGRAAARALRLPPRAYLAASAQPKAVQTLRCASGGGRVRRDPGFAEVRHDARWRDDHRERARAYVAGHEHDGWEPRAAVITRFDAAIRRHTALAAGRPLVVAGHGMALTCWLHAHGRAGDDPAAFWAALSYPDVVTVSDGRRGGWRTRRRRPARRPGSSSTTPAA